jgi:hypothetical protein
MDLEISFTNEELLEIIASPGSDAEVIFADGYLLPEGYPSLQSRVVDGELARESPFMQEFAWDQAKPLESNWAAMMPWTQEPTSAWGEGCVVIARDVFRAILVEEDDVSIRRAA